MKLIKFQIKNYKSIIDSGECYPSELVTILAGKNESGKSSILEALNDFNREKSINEKAIRIEDPNSKPEITAWFKANKDQIQEALDEAEIEYSEKIPSECVFKISKQFSGVYKFDSEFQKTIPPDIGPKTINSIKKQYALLSADALKTAFNAAGNPLPALDENNVDRFPPQFKQWKANILPHVPGISTNIQNVTLQHDIDDLEALLSVIPEEIPEKTALQRFLNGMLEHIPNFIYFDSFTDVFPSVIPLADLTTNQWVKDLAEISNLDVSIIQGSSDRQKVTHKEQINAEINQDFSQFWTQDLSNLVIEYDSQKVNFWIRENGEYYEPEIRSQGRRWHLAFYIKVSARAKENSHNIILIDEPGLYLHANAQRDILKNLEVCAKRAPIIFSTHSPYLIEEDKLERIRLIQKDSKKGTIVENKIHKVADSETLTPILTAIGLELNRGIVSVDKINNVVVEGISDYYYLNAFKEILKKPQLNFIHGGSSGNMPKIGTILQGWGCEVRYLYDNDRAYTDAQKNIRREWLAITKDLLTKISVDGAIEDMFDPKDFVEHILESPESEITEKNSTFIKNADKVLKAKNFREKIALTPKIKFEETTLENFKKLFGVLEKMHGIK